MGLLLWFLVLIPPVASWSKSAALALVRIEVAFVGGDHRRAWAALIRLI
jgi:hypothetical protein